MERGVSTGGRTDAGPLIAGAGAPDHATGAGMPDRAMTERILQVADEAGYRAALIDASDGTVTAWPRFARTVRAAADGLGRRGLTAEDTAGVLVQDAASAAVAVNAIRAAGAAVCVIGPGARPADIAARLNACGARLLITSAPLAGLAAECADRSRVRQVIAFGEAAGTTPFGSLLESGRHGKPGESYVADEHGAAGAHSLAGAHRAADSRELNYRDVVVAAPPGGDGQGYVALLDLTLLAGATLVAAPLSLVTAAMRIYKGTAAIVPHGTQVPGVPPARVFSFALSAGAGLAAARSARSAAKAKPWSRPHPPSRPSPAGSARWPATW